MRQGLPKALSCREVQGMLQKFLKSEIFSFDFCCSLKSGLCSSVFGRGDRLLSRTVAGNQAHEVP